MEEIRFKLRNKTLAGLAFGDPSKPLLLCLHGWLDNAASFIPIAPYFKDYYLVALDLPGHGLSDHRSPDAHYHLLDNIQDLYELVEQQGWQDFSFFAHSMGGILASIFTACFPEKVKKLAAVEAFGALSKEPESSAVQLRESVLSRAEVAKKTVRHPSSFDAAVTARLVAGKMNRHSAELLMQRNIDQTSEILEWRTDPRLRTISSLRLTESQAQSFIESISCPWLTLLGNQGFEKIKRNVEKRKHSVQQFHFAEVEGGHHVHMDNPEGVALCVKEFLEQ